MIYEAQYLRHHQDELTFNVWKYLVAVEMAKGFGVITVCIPYIRNMLLSMESGMIQTGQFRFYATAAELRTRNPVSDEVTAESLPLHDMTTITSTGEKSDGGKRNTMQRDAADRLWEDAVEAPEEAK